MKTSRQLNSSHSLLLNLLVRECNNWYFFNIIPKYDKNLALYMTSCQTTDFLRFDLKKDHTILYFPIHYKSLTGMHTFGDTIGIRSEKFGEIKKIDCPEALLSLLQEQFPSITLSQLITAIPRIEERYDAALKKRLFNLSSCITSTSVQNTTDTKAIILSNLVNEYAAKEELTDFLQLLTHYARKTKKDSRNATAEWLKQYTLCLLENVIIPYVEHGKIISPHLCTTGITVNGDGLPVKLEFYDKELIILKSDLPAHFNQKKIENFIQTQLLSHHLFPIVRACGLLELNTEENLLEEITHSISEFLQTYRYKDLFISRPTIFVDLFLPAFFSTDHTEYIHSQVHMHNHLINTRYYSGRLIKPEKGKLVHKRYFEDSTMEIGIRAFDIATDLEVLYEWVNKDYAKKFWEMDGPIEELEEAYIKHLGVDYSHPYIGTLNGEPIFTLELYWAIKDEVGKYYAFHPGDYGFHMLIAPARKKINNFSYYALAMCMEHFFSQPQVHRMIGEASVEHAGTHNLITKVGCEFNKALTLPYKTSNLTFLNREMYAHAVQDVLAKSCTEIYLKV